VQGQGSRYFQVYQPDDENPNVVPVGGDAAWAQVGEQMAKAWANVEKLAQNTIQAGEKDEVNPWLEPDAVVTVFSGHGVARVDGVRRGARGGARSQAGAAG
jgi:hypothetical protein